MTPDFLFQRMMQLILQKKFEEAKASAISDMNKVGEVSSLSIMLIMTAKNNEELIKVVAAFSIMSDEVKQYYTNPQKALVDYNNEP